MFPVLSRREFGAATLATVSTLSARAADVAAPPEGWIDAHVHVWTPDTEKYPLDANYKPADMQPPSFTPEQLFAHCRPSGVSRIAFDLDALEN